MSKEPPFQSHHIIKVSICPVFKKELQRIQRKRAYSPFTGDLTEFVPAEAQTLNTDFKSLS